MDVNYIIYEKNNNRLILSINNEISKIQINNISKPIDNKLVLKYLNSLFSIIYNWQKEYIDMSVIDGDTWKLSIIYTNGSKKEYCGKASYPNNFEALERLNRELING